MGQLESVYKAVRDCFLGRISERFVRRVPVCILGMEIDLRIVALSGVSTSHPMLPSAQADRQCCQVRIVKRSHQWTGFYNRERNV